MLEQMSLLEDPTEGDMLGPENEDNLTMKRYSLLYAIPIPFPFHSIGEEFHSTF